MRVSQEVGVGLPAQLMQQRSGLGKSFEKSKHLLLLVLPCLLFFAMFRYVPMFGVMISFQNYNMFKGVWQSDWVGLKYYMMFFQNPDFFLLLRNTFLLSFYQLLFGFPAPILLALLLNELRLQAFKRIVQSLSYLPHFLSYVIVASMIIGFLSPTGGLVNQVMGWFGADPVNWLIEAQWFRTIYVTSGVWQSIGWSSILYLAALTAIDPHLYEAAEMDGAGRFRKMWHISLPGIMGVTVVLLILNVGNMLDVGFEKVYLLSNPSIYETADIISTYVYRVGLVEGNYSYATAIDLFTGIINLVLLLLVNTIARRMGENSMW